MAARSVVLIGAGVIGLTTAYTILQRYPSTAVLILAAESPADDPNSWTADYASMWAGAHYRPIAPSTPREREEFKLAMKTCVHMQRLARNEPQCGVAVVPAVEHLERPRSAEMALKTGDIYASEDDGFHVLDKTMLPPGVEWGCTYNTYCVNVTQYCLWLLSEVRRMGARVVRQKVRDADDANIRARELGMRDVKVVVNCSGRGMDLDPATYPVRGQTVLVRQQYHRTITRQCSDGSWSFLIPRPNGGGTIVGGTKEVGDWRAGASLSTRRILLENAAKFFPDFVDDPDQFEVVRDNVGRRPAREGGFRAEVVPLSKGERVIHGYGAGGRGYELSWGIAEVLTNMLGSTFYTQASL